MALVRSCNQSEYSDSGIRLACNSQYITFSYNDQLQWNEDAIIQIKTNNYNISQWDQLWLNVKFENETDSMVTPVTGTHDVVKDKGVIRANSETSDM